MKLLKTSDINIVRTCQHMFGFELPSVLLDRRTRKFLEKNEKFMSWGESFQNRLQLYSHVFHYWLSCLLCICLLCFLCLLCCMCFYYYHFFGEIKMYIIINNNNIKTVFMVLSSWQSHCESSPGSFDECRMAPSGRWPNTKPDDLGCESTCTGCQSLHSPSA